MSYILEALRKSEEERQRGEVPDLFTPAPAPRGRPHPRSPYVITGLILFLGLAALLAWMRPWQPLGPASQSLPAPTAAAVAPETRAAPAPERPAVAMMAVPGPPAHAEIARSPAPAAVTEAPAAVTPAGDGVPAYAALALVPPAPPQPPAADSGRPVSEQPSATLPASSPRPLVTVSPTTTPTPQAEPTTAPGANGSAGQQDASAEPPLQRALQQALARHGAATLAPASADEAAAAAVTPPAQEPGVPGIYSLPAAVRATLPDIAFSVHVYAEQPAARRVRVNGTMLGEGDTISGDLRISAITRHGVVLETHGQRFRMGLDESWQAH